MDDDGSIITRIDETMTTNPITNPIRWIHLDDPKHYSRLLYPNPVCFLCSTTMMTMTTPTTRTTTSTRIMNHPSHCTTSTTSAIVSDNHDHNHERRHDDDMIPDDIMDDKHQPLMPQDNVMVLSWLTPIDNDGAFICSIHRSRYTCSHFFLRHHDRDDDSRPLRFVLAVPVAGMEELIRTVGRLTGRCIDKLERQPEDSMNHDYNSRADKKMKTILNNNNDNDFVPVVSEGRQNHGGNTSHDGNPHHDKNQIKWMRKKRHEHEPYQSTGIPSLRKVKVGTGSGGISSTTSSSTMTATTTATTTNQGNNPSSPSYNHDDSSLLFAIDGTCAHLVCGVASMIEHSSPSHHHHHDDQGHMIVTCHIIDAYVLSTYWDTEKHIFHPQINTIPCYLTFLGAQRFGYVVTTTATTMTNPSSLSSST